MSGRRWTYRLLALLGGVGAALLAGEGVLRVQHALSEKGESPELGWAHRPIPPEFGGDCATQPEQAELGDILWPAEDPDLVYRLIGGLDTCFRGVRLRTNPEGLRAQNSYSLAKPPGVARILVLGDSQAFGWGLPERQTVAARLTEQLEKRGFGPVEVINTAVPGYGAYQEAALLERIGMRYQPDCVLVLFTSNDLALPFFLLEDVAMPARSRSLLLARLERLAGAKRWFRRAPDDMIGFITETDIDRVPEAYRHMVGIEGYRAALGRMVAVAGEVPIVNAAEFSELSPEIGEELAELQESLGIVHLPITWPRHRRFQLDPETDPHPNRAAHRLFAVELAGALLERGLCRAPPQGSHDTPGLG